MVRSFESDRPPLAFLGEKMGVCSFQNGQSLLEITVTVGASELS